MNEDLPEGWELQKLSNILSKYESGSRPKGGVQGIKQGIPSIGGEHLTSGGNFDFSKIKYVPHDFFKKMNTGVISRGDILIVKDGATTGKVSIIRNDFPFDKAATNEHVFLCRTFDEISNYYLFYYLFSSIGQNYVKFNFKGTAQGGINLSFFENVYVPIPPLAEQQRIFNKIEELFTNLDKGIEYLKTAQEELKLTRQSVLKYALEGRLTEDWREKHKSEIEPASVLLEKIKDERKKKGNYKDLPPIDTSGNNNLPDGWAWTRIGDIYHIIGGGTPSTKKRDYWNGDIPWITSADIYGIMDIRPRRKINREAIKDSATNLVPAGSIIVVTRVGLGKVCLTDLDLCFSQDSQALVNISNLIYPKYSLYYLQKAVQIFKYKNRGTTIAGVTKKQLYDLFFSLPPLAEQQQIVEVIENYYSILDNMENTISQSLNQTSGIRQSILKKAFEGRLVPQDPNDEPASVLLERIKADKSKSEKEKISEKKNRFVKEKIDR